MQNTSWPLLLTGMSVVCGAIALIGISNIGRMLYHVRYGRRVIGKVARLNVHDGEGDTFTIDVEYEVGSKRFVVSTVVGVSPALYREGERVPVYYLVERPEKGRIVTVREVAVWIGFVLVALGMIAFLSFQASTS